MTAQAPENETDRNFLELIAKKVPANVFVFNLLTGASEFNSASVGRMIGYSSDEIVAMGTNLLNTLMHPDDMPTAVADMASAATLDDETISSPVEYRMRAKDGQWCWFSSSMRVLDRDENGHVRRVIGAAHPIQLQKDAEVALFDSKQFLEQVLDATPISIIGLDRAGRIVSINNTARHVLGGTSDPLPFDWPDGVRFANATGTWLEPEDYPTVRAVAGETYAGETFLLVNQRGKRRFVSLSSSHVDSPTSSVYCVMTFEDVTEREQQRQQIERSSRLDALGQLTGGIAHDFNNLLATIGYALQIGLDTKDPQQQAEVMQIAKDSIGKGAELTARLLAFAKRQPGSNISVEIAATFTELKGLASRVIEESIALDFDLDDEGLWAYCDPPLLESALMNLILNARDVIVDSGQGRLINVSARGVENVSEDAKLRSELKGTFISGGLKSEHKRESARSDQKTYRYIDVSVSDDGPGMTEDVKHRAVDPFFTTKDNRSGTGLGLSMVYGFVRQANGELRIYSEPGQGTTIRMLLPRGTTEGKREAPVKKQVISKGVGQRILLVEDEADLLQMMSTVLINQGYDVTVASSGEAAMAILKKDDDIDLLITDIVMPGGIGGFQLGAAAHELRPDIPLIYMSGYAGFIDEDEMIVAAPLLRKPTPPDELSRAVNQALGVLQSPTEG